MNFNNEFGYPLFGHSIIKYKYHRFHLGSTKIYARCDNKLSLWGPSDQQIQFSYICKKCLSTFSAEEIEDLKHWLILKKLGVSV